jgi:uncharacterized protein YfaP (DUF2135 family)
MSWTAIPQSKLIASSCSKFLRLLIVGGLMGGVLAPQLLNAQSSGTTAETSARKRQSGKLIGIGTTLPQIIVTSPTGGWTVGRMVEVAGEVSDRSIDPITVNINGERYLLRTKNGNFSRKFPVAKGRNTISVRGTNKAGTAEVSRKIFAEISPVAISAILTSDTDGVYTDLHIYEPSADAEDRSLPPGVHVFWANTESPSGGRFYLNEQSGSYDQPGYGPYLYTHTSPPLGIYKIDANYWPSGDKAHTLGTLNITLFGGTASEVKRVVRQPLVSPGETLTLAYVKIDKGQQASVYIPGLDPKPKRGGVWPDWVIEAPVKKLSGSSSEGE